jgi:hypothetical protein
MAGIEWPVSEVKGPKQSNGVKAEGRGESYAVEVAMYKFSENADQSVCQVMKKKR